MPRRGHGPSKRCWLMCLAECVLRSLANFIWPSRLLSAFCSNHCRFAESNSSIELKGACLQKRQRRGKGAPSGMGKSAASTERGMLGKGWRNTLSSRARAPTGPSHEIGGEFVGHGSFSRSSS
eukprot:6199887-Pleurochrysis_carterae.AAC.1